jgi:peptide/nickel transport system ATP-binding protein
MATDSPEDDPILEVQNLKKYFSNSSGFLGGLRFDSNEGSLIPRPSFEQEWVRAVDDVSLHIKRGETLGLVGESGCGKSTLARTILRLIEPTDGAVYLGGQNLTEADKQSLRSERQNMQMIFQDPQSSLDPRMKIGPIVEEPMKAHGLFDRDGREERARELLQKVGLDPQHYNRYPHQFSGGQRQRINLARALSVNPEFVICDEPTSALDASIQAQVLNTMRELQNEFDLTYLFISHDLSVIRYISDRVAVMYLGEIVEVADKQELFENPRHPYTEALLSSIPIPDPRVTEQKIELYGDVPSPINPPSGCRFRTRCPKLIAPDDVDFQDGEWSNTREFMRAVKRRSFVAERHGQIYDAFFNGTAPSGEVGRIVSEAVECVLGNDWEEATQLLQEEFAEQSICAMEKPDYEVEPQHEDIQHFAACNLHRPSGSHE